MITVSIQRLNSEFSDLPLPDYATSGSAGMDVHAAINEDLVLEVGRQVLVPTNLAIALPPGFECQVRSRSGLAIKHGVFCLNSPGTIDSDYRGEIKVILSNMGTADFSIRRGDRIAQLVVAAYEHVAWNEVQELQTTARADGGFGSTGTSVASATA